MMSSAQLAAQVGAIPSLKNRRDNHLFGLGFGLENENDHFGLGFVKRKRKRQETVTDKVR